MDPTRIGKLSVLSYRVERGALFFSVRHRRLWFALSTTMNNDEDKM